MHVFLLFILIFLQINKIKVLCQFCENITNAQKHSSEPHKTNTNTNRLCLNTFVIINFYFGVTVFNEVLGRCLYFDMFRRDREVVIERFNFICIECVRHQSLIRICVESKRGNEARQWFEKQIVPVNNELHKVSVDALWIFPHNVHAGLVQNENNRISKIIYLCAQRIKAASIAENAAKAVTAVDLKSVFEHWLQVSDLQAVDSIFTENRVSREQQSIVRQIDCRDCTSHFCRWKIKIYIDFHIDLFDQNDIFSEGSIYARVCPVYFNAIIVQIQRNRLEIIR